MKFKWSVVGAFIVGATGAVLATVSIIDWIGKPTVDLQADVHYDYLHFPSLIEQRLEEHKDEFKTLKLKKLFSELNKEINEKENSSKDMLFAEYIHGKFMRLYREPFYHDLANYKSMMFVYLENKGDKIAKNVFLKLPKKGLVEVRDDGKNYAYSEVEKSDVAIESIVPKGNTKVWVFFSDSKEKIESQSINIGYENGTADIHLYDTFTRADRLVALHWRDGLFVFALLFLAWLTYQSFFLFRTDTKEPKNEVSTEESNSTNTNQ